MFSVYRSDQQADPSFLDCGVVEVENKFQPEHYYEHEYAQKNRRAKLSVPNTKQYAGNHDEGPEECERPQKDNARSAAKVSRRNKAQREVEHNERGIRKKDQKHSRGRHFEVVP